MDVDLSDGTKYVAIRMEMHALALLRKPLFEPSNLDKQFCGIPKDSLLEGTHFSVATFIVICVPSVGRLVGTPVTLRRAAILFFSPDIFTNLSSCKLYHCAFGCLFCCELVHWGHIASIVRSCANPRTLKLDNCARRRGEASRPFQDAICSLHFFISSCSLFFIVLASLAGKLTEN